MRRLIAEREWDRLAGMGDVAVESLIEALSVGDGETRMKAAWALGEIGDRRALEPLAAALGDTEARVREKAALALGKIGEAEAVEALLGHLDDPDEAVREAVSRSLQELGWRPEEAVAAVAAAAVSAAEEAAAVYEMEEVAVTAEEVEALAAPSVGEEAVSSEEEVPEAIPADAVPAEAPEAEVGVPVGGPVAAAAPGVEAEWGVEVSKPAAEGLVEEAPVMAAEKEYVPAAGRGASIAEALIAQRRWKELLELGEEAVLPLVEVLRSGERSDRRKAAFILKEIGLPAVPSLRNLLHDRREEVRAEAREILADLGWKSGDEEELAQSLIRDGRWEEVARLGKPAVLPLARALRDAQAEKRRMAVSVLGTLADTAAFEPLVSALRDSDREVRSRAAWALGKTGDAKASQYLVQTLSDEDADVRAKSAASLERLGWSPGNDRERALYFMATRQWNKLAEVARAAEEVLRERLEDRDAEVREMSRIILQDVEGSKELEELLRGLE